MIPGVDYAGIRLLHIGCAAASIGLFVARGGMQFAGIDWRRRGWLRVLPHAIDTVLLGAAVTLALQSRQYPLAQPWLTAKLVALVVYVLAGRIALRANAPAQRRGGAFVLALASVGYIVLVALTRNPLPGWR